MAEISSGPNYRIAADGLRNRLYFWFFGDIIRPEVNPHLGQDTREACRQMKPGFTVLIDLAELKMMGLPDIVQRFQSTLLAAGVVRVASVGNRASFSKLVVDSSARKVGDVYAEKRKTLFGWAKAEAWLDAKG